MALTHLHAGCSPKVRGATGCFSCNLYRLNQQRQVEPDRPILDLISQGTFVPLEVPSLVVCSATLRLKVVVGQVFSEVADEV